jgi:tRNA pseudouridine38-40 synthase
MSSPTENLPRWKCVCAYDGTHFAGWQSQAEGRGLAIQDVIERRLAQILGTPTRIHGSGRTDSGVHALAQVFHFDADWRHGPEKLVAAFRVGLPPTIQVKTVQAAAPDFHARFQATGKRYVYHLSLGDADPFTRPYCWTVFRELDLAAMQAATGLLRGRHDFRAFTALNGPAREDTVRDLRRFDLVRRERRLQVTMEAEGFLYKMARSLVGGVVAVGEGKLTLAELRAILASRERTMAVKTAPAQGLFLAKVFYS